MDYLRLETDARGVAYLTLNRPEVHNAFDDAFIGQLIQALEEVDRSKEIRVLVLRAEGKSFSAGADLNWMQRMAAYSREENLGDARELARLMRRLNECHKPTLAQVQGAAFGGAVGLVACCDIAIASDHAKFCLSEVRLGILPAVISPYVVAAMGERNARRYMLTAERFDAFEARHTGLVHEVAAASELEARVEGVIEQLLKSGPAAQEAAKRMIRRVHYRPIEDTLIEYTAELIADIRVSDEGQEGLTAFLEKRPARWIRES